MPVYWNAGADPAVPTWLPSPAAVPMVWVPWPWVSPAVAVSASIWAAVHSCRSRIRPAPVRRRWSDPDLEDARAAERVLEVLVVVVDAGVHVGDDHARAVEPVNAGPVRVRRRPGRSGAEVVGDLVDLGALDAGDAGDRRTSSTRSAGSRR